MRPTAANRSPRRTCSSASSRACISAREPRPRGAELTRRLVHRLGQQRELILRVEYQRPLEVPTADAGGFLHQLLHGPPHPEQAEQRPAEARDDQEHTRSRDRALGVPARELRAPHGALGHLHCAVDLAIEHDRAERNRRPLGRLQPDQARHRQSLAQAVDLAIRQLQRGVEQRAQRDPVGAHLRRHVVGRAQHLDGARVSEGQPQLCHGDG